MIGDVAGHGPDEAALGAALRIAWRTLTFAGFDVADRMPQLERVLHAERTENGVFATVLSLEIPPDGRARSPRSVPVIPGCCCTGPTRWNGSSRRVGPALGLHADDWPQHEIELPAGHGLLLLTDGLFEGYSGRGNERLGEDGLLALARSHAALPGPEFVDALIDGAEQRAQARGGLTDDIAVVRVERTAR